MAGEPDVEAGYPTVLEPRRQRVAAAVARLAGALPAAMARAAVRVGTISELVLEVLQAEPDRLAARVADGRALAAADVAVGLALSGRPLAEAMAALRKFRSLEMARIAWRDLTNADTLERTLSDLSALADGLVMAAVTYAAADLEPRFGRPQDATGRDAPLLVIGMGKLGGRELNFSSDIDVVFAYPDGAVLPGRDAADSEDYFRRAAQLVIKLLDQVTAEGFVFRVDTRLRPFGASGPLVISIGALENYLVQHGRDWERYAYLKARLITGAQFQRELFDEVLTPFVYRRYLDYGVFESLRAMKRLISAEVARRDMRDNVKLGPGGIREVEFITQALQIVRGGREPALRTPSLAIALPRLAEQGQIEASTAARLVAAYRELRRVENRLQELDDRQTHELPLDAELRARLVLAMGAPSYAALTAAIAAERRVIEAEFQRIAWDAGDAPGEKSPGAEVATAWENGMLAEALAESSLATHAEVLRMLTELRASALYQRMDEISRQRLGAVVARALPELEQQADPAAVLARVLPILRAICRRSAYLALLDENPLALKRLLAVAGQSPLLARQIAEHALLLDELLDPRLFDAPPTRAELEASLRGHVARVRGDDLEARLDALRQFQRAAVFRIAIADRIGGLPLMKVSDRLTDTAELVLELALGLARAELEAKHGRPRCGEPGDLRDAEFAIVGYGKLGGLELGYGSDLDLVFLHDSSGSYQETEGPAPLDNARFFARLVQRLIHFLTLQTSSGRLYEVDTRLRPSGGSGLMVASFDSFRRYQREEAWTWEHQALLRSRSVGGAARLRESFEAERCEVLVHHVKRATLKDDVRTMRARMRKELSKGGRHAFDLKQDDGGLADIEFLVDYWVLANAGEHPELVEYPDNVRQLEALERAGLVSPADCRGLKEGYLELRRRIHELALGEAERVVDEHEFRELRDWVRARWREVFGPEADD